MRTRLTWFTLALLVGTCMSTWATPSLHDGALCPFTKEGQVHLSLTPQQAKIAQHIGRGIDWGLRVPLYDQKRWDGELPLLIGWIPIEQSIAENRARLTTQLIAEHPNPIAIQQLVHEIALEEFTLKETVDAGLVALGAILTPEQRALLPACPRLAIISKEPDRNAIKRMPI